MDYTRFKVEDFAADDLFVKWVLENDPEAERFWVSYISNHPEIARLAAIQALQERAPLFSADAERRVRIARHNAPSEWIEL